MTEMARRRDCRRGPSRGRNHLRTNHDSHSYQGEARRTGSGRVGLSQTARAGDAATLPTYAQAAEKITRTRQRGAHGDRIGALIGPNIRGRSELSGRRLTSRRWTITKDGRFLPNSWNRLDYGTYYLYRNVDCCGTVQVETLMPAGKRQPMIANLQLEELGHRGFALAMQMLGHRDDAADAVQDSLHQLVRKWRSFDAERGELTSWFLKIVRNRCVDLIRQRARQQSESVELEQITEHTSQRPDTVAEKHEMMGLLKTELMAMPEDQREIILLRDFHNLSYAEVAEMLSIPQGTVMSRLHRARVELHGRMEQYQ